MADAEKPLVFVSYKRNAEPDQTLAIAIKSCLEPGCDVFLDRAMSPGTDWRQKINESLAMCDLFVPLLSEVSTAPDSENG